PNYAHLTPIYASSTYVYDTAEQGMRRFSGQEEGYIYSRWGNPSMTEAEEKIALMEGYKIGTDHSNLPLKGILHSSGMAAISSLMLATLKTGDKILSHYSLYGGTQEIMDRILPDLGIEVIIADLRDLNIAEEALKDNPEIRMIYLETPANPTIQCVDIDELTKLGKKYGKIIACDNTFATPYLQQPFKYGVDFVVHSTTKFLNGHGTAIGGILLGSDIEFMNTKATKFHRLLGGNSNAFDAFLLINGMKTLEVRMDRHCANAVAVADFLLGHKSVTKVNYNGLPSHPDHAVAMKQMKHPGAMMSIELKGGLKAGANMMNKLNMCVRTVSLGTCDTLLSHPASMTHYGVPKEKREQYGITDGLIRMSIGMENIEDIIADLDQALS
ncbi:MAG: trans-sulfuration enzyme family protein, partial [Flavitalea sp.]